MLTMRTNRARFAALLVALLTIIGCATVTASSAAAPENLFGTTVPAVKADSDAAAVELGVQFRPAVDGTVSGVRFYKGTGNTGAHSGSVWSAAGVRLATGSFTGETASGWQTLSFAAPLAVTAGTTYTASYFAPRGHYAVNNPYAWPRVSGNLTGTRGVYRYGSTSGFPSTVFGTSNYWVDVTFVAGSVAPPTTTTAPPATTAPTTPVNPPGAFPDASNTGVPDGVTLTNSGSITVTTAGAVVDALNITGTVNINASNVTLKRSRATGPAFGVIRIADNVTGVRIEDSEVNGQGGSDGANGIWGPATIVRTEIQGVENGVVPGSGSVIQDSWIHGLAATGAPHYDGIQMDGGLSNILVDHDTIDLSGLGQTGAIMVDNYFGQISGITVQNSRLLGAGFTVYCDGQFAAPTINGVSFLNNRIAGGGYGPFLIRNCNATLSGNVDDNTGAPVTG